MAVTAADLTLPPGGTGKLDPAWFSSGELATFLAVWIAEGAALVPVGATAAQSDAVVTAYAYWQGYDTKAGRIAGSPLKENIGGAEFNSEYVKFQHDWFANQAATWKSAFTAAVAGAEPPPEVAYNPPRASYSQAASVSF